MSHWDCCRFARGQVEIGAVEVVLMEGYLSSDESFPQWREALVYSSLDELVEYAPVSSGTSCPKAHLVSLLMIGWYLAINWLLTPEQRLRHWDPSLFFSGQTTSLDRSEAAGKVVKADFGGISCASKLAPHPQRGARKIDWLYI